jgi:hypothetical protein
MSNAHDYRTKAAEFARLASEATSLKNIREFHKFRASSPPARLVEPLPMIIRLYASGLGDASPVFS